MNRTCVILNTIVAARGDIAVGEEGDYIPISTLTPPERERERERDEREREREREREKREREREREMGGGGAGGSFTHICDP